MSAPPIAPRLAKAALVVVDAFGSRKSIAFQYNPDTLSRRIEARAVANGETERWGPVRLTQPPRETISLTIELDATDSLEKSQPVAVTNGVHPALASLELLLYPELAELQRAEALAAAGSLEIIPSEAPLVLFVWGERRILPVSLSSMSVTEESHDARLNPLRAKVELSLTVLSYGDVGVGHPAYGLSIAHQVTKEALALAKVVGG